MRKNRIRLSKSPAERLQDKKTSTSGTSCNSTCATTLSTKPRVPWKLWVSNSSSKREVVTYQKLRKVAPYMMEARPKLVSNWKCHRSQQEDYPNLLFRRQQQRNQVVRNLTTVLKAVSFWIDLVQSPFSQRIEIGHIPRWLSVPWGQAETRMTMIYSKRPRKLVSSSQWISRTAQDEIRSFSIAAIQSEKR